MAKIGTAHIEIKPVLNDEALAAIIQRVEDAFTDAVTDAVKRGVAKASNPTATHQ